MPSRNMAWSVLTVALAIVGCDEGSIAPKPPSADVSGEGRPTVLVNPNAHGNGTPTTIQAGIDLVAAGGRVMVKPGTYAEALVITKGLTLEGIDEETGSVIIAPSTGVQDAIQVATTEPVVIRGVTVHAGTVHGIQGLGPVDLTIEQTMVTAVNPSLGVGRLIRLTNDPNPSNASARLVVRESILDGTITDRPAPFPQVFGVVMLGDVEALVEHNVIRRMGGACILVFVRQSDLAGHQHIDITENDLDECHAQARAGAILVTPGDNLSAARPLTATGEVNIIGNTIRNSAASCLATTAINYKVYGGRIAHNRILNVVQGCATPVPGAKPAAIWLGDLRPFYPTVTPIVRFNDIVGNAQAGLRLGPNETAPLDASCNYWGSADGPSGAGSGAGDALLVEAGGAAPSFTPYATAPIAATDAAGC